MIIFKIFLLNCNIWEVITRSVYSQKLIRPWINPLAPKCPNLSKLVSESPWLILTFYLIINNSKFSSHWAPVFGTSVSRKNKPRSSGVLDFRNRDAANPHSRFFTIFNHKSDIPILGHFDPANDENSRTPDSKIIRNNIDENKTFYCFIQALCKLASMLPVKPLSNDGKSIELSMDPCDPFEEDRRTLLILNETIAYIATLQKLAKAKKAQKS